MDQAARDRDMYDRQTVLFLDEIHRFTKAQQDALLPGVENRQVILVAATTENPSFSVIAPLLSRSMLITLDVRSPTTRSPTCSRPPSPTSAGWPGSTRSPTTPATHLVRIAGGDARRALTFARGGRGRGADEHRRLAPTSTDPCGSPSRTPSRPWPTPACATTAPATSTTTSRRP